MHERDPEPVPTDPGSSVNQLNSRFRKDAKRFDQIVNLVGDMVKSLATLCHESTDRSVRVSRLDQLNRARRQGEERSPDTLLGNVEPVRLAESQRLVGRNRRIQIGNDYPDVMQSTGCQQIRSGQG